MGEFESYRLGAGLSDTQRTNYCYNIPIKMPQQRRIGLLCDKTFSLHSIATMTELISQLGLGCDIVTDSQPVSELKMDFFELDTATKGGVRSNRNFAGVAAGLELLAECNSVIAGGLTHMSSRYQLFLEKVVDQLSQPIVVTNELLRLYRPDPSLVTAPSQHFILQAEAVVQLLFTLGETPRSLRQSPTNSWHNCISLSQVLERSCVCVGQDQVIVADPHTSELSIITVPDIARHYYLYITLATALSTLLMQSNLSWAYHCRAAASVLAAVVEKGITPTAVARELQNF